jgi:DNA polymerase-1
LFLSGKGNFRDAVATIKPYKGTRKKEKPLHYKALRKHIKQVGCILSEDEEADDLLGKYQTADTCICTIDKDLDMIAGWHYNFVKLDKYTVSPEDADLFFWWQMVVGDSCDNIPGIQGQGKAAADKMVEAAQADVERMKDAVYDAYHARYVDTWKEVMQENADLLWIRRANETRKEI